MRKQVERISVGLLPVICLSVLFLGSCTRSEIEYALRNGKKVFYLEDATKEKSLDSTE